MNFGYKKTFQEFLRDSDGVVLSALREFVPDAGSSQEKAWRDSVGILRESVSTLVDSYGSLLHDAYIILEYKVALEFRRVDALFLLPNNVVVLEFKGKNRVYQADLNQAAAYARDLKSYHRSCHDLSVPCLLIVTEYRGSPYRERGVDVLGAKDLKETIATLVKPDTAIPDIDEFLSPASYQPLPSLVKAARELFNSGSLKRIHKAAAKTQPALDTCISVIERSIRNKRRALILVSGVPGAGKTLVGLQLAHAEIISESGDTNLSEVRPLYLSGNGPLVKVLSYQIEQAYIDSERSQLESCAPGVDGKTFVRSVKGFIEQYASSHCRVPPFNNVLIYDEAQRAFDEEKLAKTHQNKSGKSQPKLSEEFTGLSEPSVIIKLAERLPDWSVVVGLIGTGQEINVGEEAGIGQWRSAIENSEHSRVWDVYYPGSDQASEVFANMENSMKEQSLQLNETIRFHRVSKLYEFVKAFLDGDVRAARRLSCDLNDDNYELYVTHSLGVAKKYLSNRYSDSPVRCYGMIASSLDKDLQRFGIKNGYSDTRSIDYGAWFSPSPDSVSSCRNLDVVVTEFGCQGLELDGSLLAWGTDLVRKGRNWSMEYADKHRGRKPKNPLELRLNAYRVLLTRGRDGCIVYIPPLPKMVDTYRYFKDCGFGELKDDQELWFGSFLLKDFRSNSSATGFEERRGRHMAKIAEYLRDSGCEFFLAPDLRSAEKFLSENYEQWQTLSHESAPPSPGSVDAALVPWSDRLVRKGARWTDGGVANSLASDELAVLKSSQVALLAVARKVCVVVLRDGSIKHRETAAFLEQCGVKALPTVLPEPEKST